MKILPLDNKQNISAKAYFKQNENFKTLYGHHKYLYNNTIEEFKRLPNHEIEILKLINDTNGKVGNNIECDVFNNSTKKALTLELSNLTTGLTELMETLASNVFRENGFFKKNEQNIYRYNILTNNDR